MKHLLVISAVLLLAASIATPQQSLTLEVQVRYTGAGVVDATHKIYVALWDTPEPAGPPSAVEATTSKNGIVKFSNIQKSPVYATTAYDPTGQWDASTPPPSGTSLGVFSTSPPKPDPINVTSGKVAKVTISFDDKNKQE